MGELAEEITRQGGFADPVWREVFFRVPRHRFVPDWVWARLEDGSRLAISRTDGDAYDREHWWRIVYGDNSVVTQVDDGLKPAPGAVGEYPTSSTSQPSAVIRMLEMLNVEDGQRVLEIGTGTGWNAALLCARLGDDRVTTVEIDPDLTERARAALTGLGYRPSVVCGDGEQGYLPNASYDRVIVTAAAQCVPYPWVEQTRPGGLIVLPWGRGFSTESLVRLTVTGDGSASGRFVGQVGFMWLRGQRLSCRLADAIGEDDEADETTATLDPWAIVGNPDAEFAIDVHVPGCTYLRRQSEDEPDAETLWLLDGRGSWAAAGYRNGSPTADIDQHGPRRLWDEIETAYRWWTNAGRPTTDRFGMTITPHRQTIWLDNPKGQSWNLTE